MKPISISLISFLLLLTASSCQFAPDMSWVPEVKVEKKFTGVRESNFPEGGIRTRIQIVNDMRHGKATSYYKNGQINTEMYYVNDRKDGPFRWYHPNGKLYQEGEYRDNKLDGELKEYDLDGNLSQVKYYSRGYQIR